MKNHEETRQTPPVPRFQGRGNTETAENPLEGRRIDSRALPAAGPWNDNLAAAPYHRKLLCDCGYGNIAVGHKMSNSMWSCILGAPRRWAELRL